MTSSTRPVTNGIGARPRPPAPRAGPAGAGAPGGAPPVRGAAAARAPPPAAAGSRSGRSRAPSRRASGARRRGRGTSCSAHAGSDSAVLHHHNHRNGLLFGNEVVEDQIRAALGRPRPAILTHAVLEVEHGVTRLRAL